MIIYVEICHKHVPLFNAYDLKIFTQLTSIPWKPSTVGTTITCANPGGNIKNTQ